MPVSQMEVESRNETDRSVCPASKKRGMSLKQGVEPCAVVLITLHRETPKPVHFYHTRLKLYSCYTSSKLGVLHVMLPTPPPFMSCIRMLFGSQSLDLYVMIKAEQSKHLLNFSEEYNIMFFWFFPCTSCRLEKKFSNSLYLLRHNVYSFPTKIP